MVSNLSGIVNLAIGNRKEAINKAVYNYGEKVRDIERKADRGSDLQTIMNDLRSLFGYNLTNDDYRRIEKELSYKIK